MLTSTDGQCNRLLANSLFIKNTMLRLIVPNLIDLVFANLVWFQINPTSESGISRNKLDLKDLVIGLGTQRQFHAWRR